jgi:hypothetical protein
LIGARWLRLAIVLFGVAYGIALEWLGFIEGTVPGHTQMLAMLTGVFPIVTWVVPFGLLARVRGPRGRWPFVVAMTVH